MPYEELFEWAESLSIESELIEWYLNPDFAAIERTYEKLSKLSETQQSEGLLNFKSTGSESIKLSEGMNAFKIDETFDIDDEENKENKEKNDDEKDEKDDIDLSELKKESGRPEQEIGKTVKVKLVIAEICKSNTQKAIRKMLSPILTTLDTNQQFGMFHSALIVGPWYLEWNNSSLCIPRRCYSSAAILAADLEIKGTKKFPINEVIDKLSKIIVDWNVNKVYNKKKKIIVNNL